MASWKMSSTYDAGINPPIRGSIGATPRGRGFLRLSQSPYKGFNSNTLWKSIRSQNSLNPPIRGSIGISPKGVQMKKTEMSQSPYKGFNRHPSLSANQQHLFSPIWSQSPYKGFNSLIEGFDLKSDLEDMSQSPYKGFNSNIDGNYFYKRNYCLNPPIRGSIVNLPPKLPKKNCLNPPIRGSIEERMENEK